MKDPKSIHFEISNEDYSETKTVNLEQLLLEQSKNSVSEMFVLLVTNLYERQLLSTGDVAELIGVNKQQLDKWSW